MTPETIGFVGILALIVALWPIGCLIERRHQGRYNPEAQYVLDNLDYDAMTFYTGECRECDFITEPDVPLRRFERELESHSRMTRHTMFQVDAWVILGEEPQVSPPPVEHR